jgi:SAM-dependent methyltransferase
MNWQTIGNSIRWPFFRRSERSIEVLRHSLSTVKTAAYFCSTPWSVVREILELAEAGPTDVLYDLGSGDGRIPILAAQEFGCRAMGIELDRDLVEYSARRVVELNLQNRVSFVQGNFFEADLSPATIVVLYLLSAVNGHLRARLASHLGAGSRVVAVDFDVPGWRADRTLSVVSDGNVEYTLYLYRRATAGSHWQCSPPDNASLPSCTGNAHHSKQSPAHSRKDKEND